jgi:hypothetical protein
VASCPPEAHAWPWLPPPPASATATHGIYAIGLCAHAWRMFSCTHHSTPDVPTRGTASAAGRSDHTWLSTRCGVCLGHAWCREPFPFQVAYDDEDLLHDAASSHVRSLTTRGPVRVRVGLGLGPSVGVCAHAWLYVLLKPTRGPGFRLPPPQPQPHRNWSLCPRVAYVLLHSPQDSGCAHAWHCFPPPPRRWAPQPHMAHTWRLSMRVLWPRVVILAMRAPLRPHVANVLALSSPGRQRQRR